MKLDKILFHRLYFMTNKTQGHSQLPDVPAQYGRSVVEGFVLSLESNKTDVKHYTSIPTTQV